MIEVVKSKLRAAVSSRPQAIPLGRVVSLSPHGQEGLDYFIYRPLSGRETADERLLVSVHGITRNAISHVLRFRGAAERSGVTVVAPLFRTPLFHYYQRFLTPGTGLRADDALALILTDVRSRLELPNEPFALFGFSGGGQFVHRFAMAYPDRVSRVVITAPGWYTFPNTEKAFPHGTRPSRKMPDVIFDPESYLRVPMRAIVGTEDNRRDSALNKARRIDRQQGRTRVARAKNWVAAMNAEAEALGIVADISFELVEGAGHSFSDFADHYGLCEQAMDFLYEGDHVLAAAAE